MHSHAPCNTSHANALFPSPYRCSNFFRKCKRALQFGAKSTFVLFYSVLFEKRSCSKTHTYIEERNEIPMVRMRLHRIEHVLARSQADIPVCRSSQVDVRNIFKTHWQLWHWRRTTRFC